MEKLIGFVTKFALYTVLFLAFAWLLLGVSPKEAWQTTSKRAYWVWCKVVGTTDETISQNERIIENTNKYLNQAQ